MFSKNKFLLFSFFIAVALLFNACNINEYNAPSWDVNLNIPFSNKTYNIFDIIKRSNNVGVDSLNSNMVFLYGESNYNRSFGEDIKFDGLAKTEVTAPSTLQLDTSIVIDDSTLVRRMEFLNGNLNFTFFNNSNESYSVTATIKNLFSVNGNDTTSIVSTVEAKNQKTIDLNLSQYYLKNDVPENSLKIRLIFKSSQPVAVRFNYSLSQYSIRNIEGRMKPLSTGITNDEVIDPFGSDVPQGEINFASITPNKNFFITKKYSSIYQVDFTNLCIVGENKNGHRVRLKYLKHGNPGDPIDSIFSLTLPSDRDSSAFPINENNSNILEFINNIPKKIEVTRNDFLNLSYKEGGVSFTDSLSLKLMIQVPLNMSITEPIVFSDTADVGIDNEDDRKNLDAARNIDFTLNSVNGFPLKGSVKITFLDSFFTPLIAISRIVGNQQDSSVNVNSARVGSDGFVNELITTSHSSELDSNIIQKIKHIGKIIYEYKIFTDPNIIPPPFTTVKVRGSDIVRTLCFGKLKYRINSGN